jgi:hypothetical protein
LISSFRQVFDKKIYIDLIHRSRPGGAPPTKEAGCHEEPYTTISEYIAETLGIKRRIQKMFRGLFDVESGSGLAARFPQRFSPMPTMKLLFKGYRAIIAVNVGQLMPEPMH